MKKTTIFLVLFFAGCSSFAFYDFCESPQDYNTFPAAYDLKTEYWKDIPEYGETKIHIKSDKKIKNNGKCVKLKKSDRQEKNIIIDTADDK